MDFYYANHHTKRTALAVNIESLGPVACGPDGAIDGLKERKIDVLVTRPCYFTVGVSEACSLILETVRATIEHHATVEHHGFRQTENLKPSWDLLVVLRNGQLTALNNARLRQIAKQ